MNRKISFPKNHLWQSIGIGFMSILIASGIDINCARAVIVKGTFIDALAPSLYPGSLLTGSFSFDSEFNFAPGIVSSKDIIFSDLTTSGQPPEFTGGDFNGTGWSFSRRIFTFNTQTKLFEGVYELERTCLRLPDGSCQIDTIGQSISNSELVIWDLAPNQLVTIITGEIPPPNPKPVSLYF
jgi:hypothetical protein